MPIILPESSVGRSSTLKDLREEVLSFEFSQQHYAPLVNKWLNEAQVRAVIEGELRTQEASEPYVVHAGQASVELPTDFSRIIDFYETATPYSLQEISAQEFDGLPSSKGQPNLFGVFSNTLTLYPVPDATYNLALRYWRLPSVMEEDVDTPEIPFQYHETLVAWATWRAYLKENDYQAGAYWKEVWDQAILKMRGEAVSDTSTGGRQVGGSGYDHYYLPRIYRA